MLNPYLPVPFQMFSDGDRLLDQMVQILWHVGSQTIGLQDTQDLVSCDESSLGDTMTISEDHTWR